MLFSSSKQTPREAVAAPTDAASQKRLEVLEIQVRGLARSFQDLQDTLARAPFNSVLLRGLVQDVVKEQLRRERYEPGTVMVREAELRRAEPERYHALTKATAALPAKQTAAAQKQAAGITSSKEPSTDAKAVSGPSGKAGLATGREEKILERSLEKKHTVGLDIEHPDTDWRFNEMHAKGDAASEKKKAALIEKNTVPVKSGKGITSFIPGFRKKEPAQQAQPQPAAAEEKTEQAAGKKAAQILQSSAAQQSEQAAPSPESGGNPGQTTLAVAEPLPEVSTGTVLISLVEEEAEVYESMASSKVVRYLRFGEAVTTAGAPEEINGRVLVPIVPGGSVELQCFRAHDPEIDTLQLQSAASSEYRRGAVARSLPNTGFNPAALAAINPCSSPQDVKHQMYMTHHLTSDVTNRVFDQNDFESLFDAIRDGDSEEAIFVITSTEFRQVNIKDTKARTLLSFAAEKGLGEVCRAVLGHPRFVEFDSRDTIGRTALHCAASSGSADVCGNLLEETAFTEVNARDQRGMTALHHAAYNGSVEACLVLLGSERFTTADAADSDGCTALHLGAEQGHAEVCFTLIEHIRFKKKNAKSERGYNALHWGAYGAARTVCEAILNCEWFTESDATDWNGWTVLHVAAQHADKDVCLLLLEHPSSSIRVNAKDWQGRTALHIAGECGNASFCQGILQVPNFSEADAKDRDGQTALHYAAEKGHVEVCRILVDSKVFTAEDTANNRGYTVIDVAQGKAKQWLLKELIARKRMKAISGDAKYYLKKGAAGSKGPTAYTPPQSPRR